MTFRKKNDEDRAQPKPNRVKTTKYIKLEERRVLNATFAFDLVASELTLENFVDSDAGNDSVNISQLGNDFVFSLNDGTWASSGPVTDLDFTLSDGDSVLTINDGALSLSSLVFNDTTSDMFDIVIDDFDFGGTLVINSGIGTFGTVSEQSSSSSVSIDMFSFSVANIDFSTGQHDFGLIGGQVAQNLNLSDQNELQLQFVESNGGTITIEAAGSIDVTNAGSGISSLSGGDINLTTTSPNSDINIGTSIFANGGNIDLVAADQVLLLPFSSIESNGGGDISILANVLGGDDGGLIHMSDGSVVNSETGRVSLTTSTGTGSGDILLSEVVSGSAADAAISIDSSGRIVDGTAIEFANLSAATGGISLVANGDIGDVDFANINTNTNRLGFSTFGAIHIDDVGSVTIDSIGLFASVSNAQGGGIVSARQLTISTDVVFGDSATLLSNRFGVPDNDIVINNHAVVVLDSTIQATLTIDAADDLIFDSGSVITAGNESHVVQLTADRETVLDGDIGSITNTANGPANTITTNLLVLNAGDGIGDSSEADAPSEHALRIDVDSVMAENTTGGNIRILETGDVSILEIVNIGRGIDFTAEQDIRDGDTPTNDVDIVGGNVSVASLNGSIGDGQFEVFKFTDINGLEVDSTTSLVASATNGSIAINQISIGPAVFNADTALLVSTGDVDASQSTFNVTNLALVADWDNDGAGQLIVGDEINVSGDLRIEGHEILSLDPVDTPTTANLLADRLLISTDVATEFTTHVNQLDIEFDFAVDSIAQTDGNSLLVSNSKSLSLIDLDCNNHAAISTLDDVKIVADGDVLIESKVNLTGSAFFHLRNGRPESTRSCDNFRGPTGTEHWRKNYFGCRKRHQYARSGNWRDDRF